MYELIKVEKEIKLVVEKYDKITCEDFDFSVLYNQRELIAKNWIAKSEVGKMENGKDLVNVNVPIKQSDEKLSKALKKLSKFVSYLGFIKNSETGRKRITKLTELRTAIKDNNHYKTLKDFDKENNLFMVTDSRIYVNPTYVQHSEGLASLSNLIRFNAHNMTNNSTVSKYVFLMNNKEKIEELQKEIAEETANELGLDISDEGIEREIANYRATGNLDRVQEALYLKNSHKIKRLDFIPLLLVAIKENNTVMILTQKINEYNENKKVA